MAVDVVESDLTQPLELIVERGELIRRVGIAVAEPE